MPTARGRGVWCILLFLPTSTYFAGELKRIHEAFGGCFMFRGGPLYGLTGYPTLEWRIFVLSFHALNTHQHGGALAGTVRQCYAWRAYCSLALSCFSPGLSLFNLHPSYYFLVVWSHGLGHLRLRWRWPVSNFLMLIFCLIFLGKSTVCLSLVGWMGYALVNLRVCILIFV